MLQLNRVLIAGQLTSKPTLKYSRGGTALTEFTMTSENTFRGPNGAGKTEVTPVKVVIWGKAAEACAEHLDVGSHVLVDGRLKLNEWDARDGTHHSSLDVTGTFVQFLSYKNQPDPKEVHAEEEVPF